MERVWEVVILKLLGSPLNFPELPKLWDGQPISWGTWEERIPTSLDHHHPGWAECPGCGLSSSLWTSTGWWLRSTFGSDWQHRGMRNFHATRCGWCGNTTVLTMHDEQSWMLDESDYGPQGSHDTTDADKLF